MAARPAEWPFCRTILPHRPPGLAALALALLLLPLAAGLAPAIIVLDNTDVRTEVKTTPRPLGGMCEHSVPAGGAAWRRPLPAGAGGAPLRLATADPLCTTRPAPAAASCSKPAGARV